LEIVKKALSRNKYKKLKSMIHFQGNGLDNKNKRDQSVKIRNVMESVNVAFEQFWTCEEFMSVDEMIVRYYGHNSLRHFIHGKSIRFGYRLWAVCGISGHFFNLSCIAQRT
jgi:hypothetical protein